MSEKGIAGRLSTKPEGKHGNRRNGRGKAEETKGTEAHRGTHCEGEAGSGERKKQRPSSEVLKRRRTKGSGSQASAPEERSERGSPVEQLRERSREGRKETNRRLSMQNRKGCTGNRAERKGKSGGDERNRRAPGSRCEAKPGGEQKGRTVALSSRKRKVIGRKKEDRMWKM